MKEGSWKNICSSGRNGVTTHSSPAHPRTPWDKGGWQCVFWVTKTHIGGRQSWEYWELSMGRVCLEPIIYVSFVKLKMLMGGKQYEPGFSYVWARCAKWETLLLFLANSPVLFPVYNSCSIFFSSVYAMQMISFQIKWEYEEKISQLSRKSYISPLVSFWVKFLHDHQGWNWLSTTCTPNVILKMIRLCCC